MNPLTNIKNQNLMNQRELELGYTSTRGSWHNKYNDSAWIYIGGLNYDLTEGDVICVFSQYGEIANINLVRDTKTGKSKGFAFICYEDQKSTVLASDNLNGITLAGRIIRVDHVEQYRVPKNSNDIIKNADLVTQYVHEKGCGPEVMRKVIELQKTRDNQSENKDLHKNKPKELYNSIVRVKKERKSRSRSPISRISFKNNMRNPSPNFDKNQIKSRNNISNSISSNDVTNNKYKTSPKSPPRNLRIYEHSSSHRSH